MPLFWIMKIITEANWRNNLIWKKFRMDLNVKWWPCYHCSKSFNNKWARASHTNVCKRDHEIKLLKNFIKDLELNLFNELKYKHGGMEGRIWLKDKLAEVFRGVKK